MGVIPRHQSIIGSDSFLEGNCMMGIQCWACDYNTWWVPGPTHIVSETWCFQQVHFLKSNQTDFMSHLVVDTSNSVRMKDSHVTIYTEIVHTKIIISWLWHKCLNCIPQDPEVLSFRNHHPWLGQTQLHRSALISWMRPVGFHLADS